MTDQHKVIHWFRQDLRTVDNPGLFAANKIGSILPVYIFDEIIDAKNPMGDTSKCWLQQSLNQLNKSLSNNLLFECGNPEQILIKLINKYNIDTVHWNRCYEPLQIARDKRIKQKLRELGITVNTYNGYLLWEPWDIKNKSGENYKVFTAFYRKGCLQGIPPQQPHKKTNPKSYIQHQNKQNSIIIKKTNKDRNKVVQEWGIGEEKAHDKLDYFIKNKLKNYKKGRDIPGDTQISMLSAHLHWGEISPQQIWHKLKNEIKEINTDCFLSELGWREFSYSLLFYYPELDKKNLKQEFNRFSWKKDTKLLEKWKQGLTGYPIIDAGMRELLETGFMHNRLRMVTASFLIKNLMIDWREGEKHFWDMLVDADLASNSAGWQWVAGCGADAAPFFRIFNPTTQGKKFDPNGSYTRKYVPELANIPDQYLHEPWLAPATVLKASNIELGKNYPKPIVDLSSSRARALQEYKKIRNQT